MFVLIEVGHGYPPLGLLHHVGLVPQIDVDDGWRQLAGLSIHLHGDGLVGGERHLFTLMEPFAMATHLQRGLDTRQQINSGDCIITFQGKNALLLKSLNSEDIL